MKILYLSSARELSLNANVGYSTHIREIIRVFEQEGNDVTKIICGDIGKNSNNVRRFENIRTHMPMFIRTLKRDVSTLLWDRWLYHYLSEVVLSFKPDVIYERSAYLLSSGCRISKKFKIPIALEVNSPTPYEVKQISGAPLDRLGARKEKQKYEIAKSIIVVSSALKDWIIKNYKIQPQKIIVLSNGVDFDFFFHDKMDLQKSRQSILNKFGIHNKSIVGFIGSFAKWHDIDLLMKAFVKALPYNPNLHLLLVGDGPKRIFAEDYSKVKKIASSVTFTGKIPRENIPDYLSAIDIAIVPANNNWYGSPIKIFEYGAMGIPIIASNFAPIAEVLKNGEDGVLVPPNDEQAMADAILKLASAPDLQSLYGKQFQRKVKEFYIWDIIGQKTLNILKQSCNTKE